MTKKAEQTHILVLRFSALGDVAMTVPVLQALTNKYPHLKITMVSRGFHKPLFEGIKGVSFYSANLKGRHKGVFGLWQLAKEVQKLKIDVVADIHQVLRSNVVKLFLKVYGIRTVQIDKGRKEKQRLTRQKNKDFRQLRTSHQRYADVFSKLGYPITLKNRLVRSKYELSKNTINVTGEKKGKWIGIAPFAAHSGKMLPFENTKAVVENLKNTEKYKIMLFGGGANEIAKLNQVAGDDKNVVNIAGKLTFEEELQLISNLDLMVSMDSANAHLAANYGVPVITLWGITHPVAGFYPFGQPLSNALLSDRDKYPAIPTSVYGNKVPKGYENVMDTITVKDILLKIERVLETENQ